LPVPDLVQILAADEVHHQEKTAAGSSAGPVYRHNRRMGERRNGSRFEQKSAHGGRIADKRLAQELYGDFITTVAPQGTIDRARGPRADLLLKKKIAPFQRRVEVADRGGMLIVARNGHRRWKLARRAGDELWPAPGRHESPCLVDRAAHGALAAFQSLGDFFMLVTLKT